MHILTSLSLPQIKFNINILPPVFWKRSWSHPLHTTYTTAVSSYRKTLHDALTFVAVLLLRGDIIQSCALRYLKPSLESGFAAEWPEPLKAWFSSLSRNLKAMAWTDSLVHIYRVRTGKEDSWTTSDWTAAAMVYQKLSYTWGLLTCLWNLRFFVLFCSSLKRKST